MRKYTEEQLWIRDLVGNEDTPANEEAADAYILRATAEIRAGWTDEQEASRRRCTRPHVIIPHLISRHAGQRIKWESVE